MSKETKRMYVGKEPQWDEWKFRFRNFDGTWSKWHCPTNSVVELIFHNAPEMPEIQTKER
jgi:hypothetical protein